MKRSVLKLGTRRSMLAWAQSSWVGREIESRNPGLKVELVGIDTRGDLILDTPLSQVQGKEFFVAEIDEALRSGTVDLTVHSMKDLSLERPLELKLAAVPRRENQRDIILYGPGVLEKLRAGRPLRIGTSAPRRLENIPGFLARALPQVGASGTPQIEFIEIRGNVNTRAGRLHEPPGSAKHLDGVVLAFAGLIRLWADETGRAELRRLLTGLRWMILPLGPCPSAPAQGALAVECRANDEWALACVGKLHHAQSQRHVAVEREVLREWGGGCHQRFGASSIAHPELGDLFFARGKKSDGSFIDQLTWAAPPLKSLSKVRAWDGSRERGTAILTQSPKNQPDEFADCPAAFVAHGRALEGVRPAAHTRVWTSGVASWFALASQGHWVEGCAEGLGFEWVRSTLDEAVLQLPEPARWVVFTHEDAVEGWREVQWAARVVATYRIEQKPDNAVLDNLRLATHIYWSSGSQFKAFGALAPKAASHACGPGKTATVLRKDGIAAPVVFPSAEEWRKWIQNETRTEPG